MEWKCAPGKASTGSSEGSTRACTCFPVAACLGGRFQRMVWRWSLEMEEELEPTWELSAPVLDLTQLADALGTYHHQA